MLVQALLVGTVVGTTNLQRADTFDAVEEALLSNKSNLYLLKETFLSSSRSPPTLLIVTYEVATTNSSYQQHTLGWSSSSVFATINPNIVRELQSGILSVAFYSEGIAIPHKVKLSLNITNSEKRLSSQEITVALKSITERVSSTSPDTMHCFH